MARRKRYANSYLLATNYTCRKEKIFSRTENLNDAGLLADVVIMKAIDKDGEKIFSLEDKLPIMHKVDSDVLSKIAVAMVQTPSPEELKKK